MNPDQAAKWLREFTQKNAARLKDDQRLTFELIAKMLEMQYTELKSLQNDRK
jgi:hypothetical protein